VGGFPWIRENERWCCPLCPYAIPVKFLPGGVNEALREPAAAHSAKERNRVACEPQPAGDSVTAVLEAAGCASAEGSTGMTGPVGPVLALCR